MAYCRTVRFERPNRPWNHQYQWQVTAENLLASCVYVAVRLVPEANWMNERDQFLAPNDDWQSDKSFQIDCLTYALFSTKNNLRSNDGPNNWQPFTEKQLGLRVGFRSHFMTDFIESELEAPVTNTQLQDRRFFSESVQRVFDSALPLWKYYYEQKDADLNATYYDIREYFCGRSEKTGYFDFFYYFYYLYLNFY